MKDLAKAFCALLFVCSSSAMAIGDIWIEPENPTSADVITIHVEHEPFEDEFADEFVKNGNTIRVNFYSSDPPFPGPDSTRVISYEYGKLPAGEYVFEYYWGPVPDANDYIGSQSITVVQDVGQGATPIPVLSPLGYLLAGALMLLMTYRNMRKNIS